MSSRLDVTDLLLDPEVAGETFVVVRRRLTVGAHGRVETGRERHTAVGSVTPTGDQSLAREDAYATQSKSIRVVTSFALRGPSKDRGPGGQEVQYLPDVVVWGGDFYVPVSISDYSQFGAGFVEADCTSMDFVDQVPEVPAS